MDLCEVALRLHEECRGKLKIEGKMPVKNDADLALAYTPGVAEPCRKIKDNPNDVYKYTNKGNFVAVVSNGTAVLGLGQIGPLASLPVMEGKAVLFKEFGGVDGFPIIIQADTSDQVIETVERIALTFGGINLEDIKAPECFYIESELKKRLDIPVFHDDQHGTAIIALGGLINALKVVNKQMNQIKVVINGAGAAGISIARLLLDEGVEDLILVDINGALCKDCPGLNEAQTEIAAITNRAMKQGSLADVIQGADVFIGVSAANVLKKEMVEAMADSPIVFALANPVPEIEPELAKAAGAAVVATGRSDYPNQVNNVLAFPGIFRGALDVQAVEINEAMKRAAAHALAKMVKPEELSREYILPKAFNREVGPTVAAAVAEAAVQTGVARIKRTFTEELELARKVMSL